MADNQCVPTPLCGGGWQEEIGAVNHYYIFGDKEGGKFLNEINIIDVGRWTAETTGKENLLLSVSFFVFAFFSLLSSSSMFLSSPIFFVEIPREEDDKAVMTKRIITKLFPAMKKKEENSSMMNIIDVGRRTAETTRKENLLLPVSFFVFVLFFSLLSSTFNVVSLCQLIIEIKRKNVYCCLVYSPLYVSCYNFGYLYTSGDCSMIWING